MAVTAIDNVTTATKFFKTYYRDYMGNDVPNISPAFRLIDGRAKKITAGGTSLNVTWAHKSYDGVGIGALSDGGDFPTAADSGAINYTLGLSHLAFTVKWTGHLEAAGTSKTAGWAGDYVKMKAKELRNKQKSVVARLLMNDGTANFGVIASIEASGANKYITVTGLPVHAFMKNETLTIRDAAASGSEQLTGSGDGQITDLDYVNGRIVLAHTQGAAVADYVAISGLYDQTVPNGIQNIVSNTGAIAGITRTTAGNYLAQANYFDASSASLDSTDFDELRDIIEEVAGLREGSYRSTWLCNPKMRRWAVLATVGQNRFTDINNMQVGVSSMNVGDKDGTKELVTDPYCTDGDLYCVDFGKWVMAYPEGMKGGYAVETSGSVFHRANASGNAPGHADAQLMYWVWRGNVAADDYRCQGRKTNLVSP